VLLKSQKISTALSRRQSISEDISKNAEKIKMPSIGSFLSSPEFIVLPDTIEELNASPINGNSIL
jgi:hypothetical protein